MGLSRGIIIINKEVSYVGVYTKLRTVKQQ